MLSEKDDAQLCSTKSWDLVRMFLGNSKLCTAKCHLSAIPDTVCILGRKDNFKTCRLVLKTQYFWIEKLYQIIYVNSAECDSNNFVISGKISSSPPRDLQDGLHNFRKTRVLIVKMVMWWTRNLWEMVRIYFAAWKDLILRVPIENPIEVINNFWNRSFFVSCYFMSWLFVFMLLCDVEDKCCILCFCFCCESNENRMVEIISCVYILIMKTLRFFSQVVALDCPFLLKGHPAKEWNFWLQWKYFLRMMWIMCFPNKVFLFEERDENAYDSM